MPTQANIQLYVDGELKKQVHCENVYNFGLELYERLGHEDPRQVADQLCLDVLQDFTPCIPYGDNHIELHRIVA